jgi:hypothetical protein
MVDSNAIEWYDHANISWSNDQASKRLLEAPLGPINISNIVTDFVMARREEVTTNA